VTSKEEVANRSSGLVPQAMVQNGMPLLERGEVSCDSQEETASHNETGQKGRQSRKRESDLVIETDNAGNRRGETSEGCEPHKCDRAETCLGSIGKSNASGGCENLRTHRSPSVVRSDNVLKVLQKTGGSDGHTARDTAQAEFRREVTWLSGDASAKGAQRQPHGSMPGDSTPTGASL
jgi:hypothetical protein